MKSQEHDDAIPIAPMTRPIGAPIDPDRPSSQPLAAAPTKVDSGAQHHAIATCPTRSEADANDLVAAVRVRGRDPEDRRTHSGAMTSATAAHGATVRTE